MSPGLPYPEVEYTSSTSRSSGCAELPEREARYKSRAVFAGPVGFEPLAVQMTVSWNPVYFVFAIGCFNQTNSVSDAFPQGALLYVVDFYHPDPQLLGQLVGQNKSHTGPFLTKRLFYALA